MGLVDAIHVYWGKKSEKSDMPIKRRKYRDILPWAYLCVVKLSISAMTVARSSSSTFRSTWTPMVSSQEDVEMSTKSPGMHWPWRRQSQWWHSSTTFQRAYGLLMPAAPRGSDGIPPTLLPAGETKLSVYNLHRVACEDSDAYLCCRTNYSFQVLPFLQNNCWWIVPTLFPLLFDSGFRMAILYICLGYVNINSTRLDRYSRHEVRRYMDFLFLSSLCTMFKCINRVRRQSGFPTFIPCQRQDVNVLPKRRQSHQGDKLCDVSTVPLVARWPVFLARGSDADGEPHYGFVLEGLTVIL